MSRVKNAILLPKNRELDGLLQQLGIQRESPKLLTEEDAEKAHLPFNFFQAFAKLTEGHHPPEDLLAFREEKLEMEKVEEDFPVLQNKKLSFRGPFFTQTLFLNFQPDEISVPTHNPLLKMDAAEARVLVSALRLLGREDLQNSATQQNGEETLENSALARIRIQHLGVEECWLGPQAMRIGLFGSVNGELSHQLGGIYLEGKIQQRETTRAHEFTCPYLPMMEGLINGLSFVVDAMPLPIYKAAQSVVTLESKGGIGSGIVVGHEYILTNRHVIKDLQNPTPEKVHLKIGIGEEMLECDAEVIEVHSRATGFKDPDLVLLHVSSLPKNIRPLPFSRKKNCEGETLFAIGTPVQKEDPLNLLVTTGKITNSTPTEDGRVVMTAPLLPGNSGGAVVDSHGDIVGIVVSLRFYTQLKQVVGTPFHTSILPLPELRTEKTRILGAEIYPVSLWGESIQHAMKTDQKSRKNK